MLNCNSVNKSNLYKRVALTVRVQIPLQKINFRYMVEVNDILFLFPFSYISIPFCNVFNGIIMVIMVKMGLLMFISTIIPGNYIQLLNLSRLC